MSLETTKTANNCDDYQMIKTDYMAPDVEAWSTRILETLRGTKGRNPPPEDIRWAVLVLDVQEIFANPESPAYIPAWESARIQSAKVLCAAEKTGTPVFRTRHIHPESDAGGSIGHFFGRLIKRADPLSKTMDHAQGAVMEKSRNSAFVGTHLEETLFQKGIQGLIICGVRTPLCVLATAVDAGGRGFVPAVVLDGTAAASQRLHVASLETLSSGLAHVITSTEASALLGADSKTQGPSPFRPTGAKREDHREIVDVLVVGGGPAGIAAAMQATREGLTTALVTNEPPGGLLAAAGPLAATAGIVDGLKGMDVCSKLETGLKTAGIRPIKGEVTALCASWIEGPRVSPIFLHEATLDNCDADNGCLKIHSRTVILAVGTTPRFYDPPGWKEVLAAGRGHRDIRTLPSKLDEADVVVIGGGDAAWDTALSARAGNARVILMCRADSDRNVALNLRKRAEKENGKMFNIMFNRIPVRMKKLCSNRIEILHRKYSRDEPVANLSADHVIACVGRTPGLTGIEEEYGPFCRNIDGVRESPQGVFIAGDADSGKNRYLLRALGSGQCAGIAAARYLSAKGWKASGGEKTKGFAAWGSVKSRGLYGKEHQQ